MLLSLHGAAAVSNSRLLQHGRRASRQACSRRAARHETGAATRRFMTLLLQDRAAEQPSPMPITYIAFKRRPPHQSANVVFAKAYFLARGIFHCAQNVIGILLVLRARNSVAGRQAKASNRATEGSGTTQTQRNPKLNGLPRLHRITPTDARAVGWRDHCPT